MMRSLARLPALFGLLLAGAMFTVPLRAVDAVATAVLHPEEFAPYTHRFNTMEPEGVVNLVPNAQAWDWLRVNIPFFACPDRSVEEMYYYRWWALRKHLRRTADGRYVFTEFITRPRPVSSALGHQLMEGRWLHDQHYFDDYALYWLRGGPGGTERADLHKYSQWLAWALYHRYLVTGDRTFITSVLNDLVSDYGLWEVQRQRPDGLFWQYDVRDAMEESISGSRTKQNLRPTINSYMYGNAVAIAAIARLAGRPALAAEFDYKAARLRRLTEAELWDPKAKFFEVREQGDGFANVREELGYIPWYFDLPEPGHGYAAAWAQLTDPRGFWAPYGITTAEQRSPYFRTHGVGHCEWDGAVWPFATSQTLTALANELRDYPPQHDVTDRDYFRAFLTYVKSQHADGKPYIGEYLDQQTGRWINGKGGRSWYYNHSTFADLLITGVVGLCPRADNLVEVHPLLPPGTWPWFCLDGVKYHGHVLTILWDHDGSHYHRGAGLTLLADGKAIAHADRLEPMQGRLP